MKYASLLARVAPVSLLLTAAWGVQAGAILTSDDRYNSATATADGSVDPPDTFNQIDFPGSTFADFNSVLNVSLYSGHGAQMGAVTGHDSQVSATQFTGYGEQGAEYFKADQGELVEYWGDSRFDIQFALTSTHTYDLVGGISANLNLDGNATGDLESLFQLLEWNGTGWDLLINQWTNSSYVSLDDSGTLTVGSYRLIASSTAYVSSGPSDWGLAGFYGGFDFEMDLTEAGGGTVPEPLTLSLLGLGLFGMRLARRH